MNLSKIEAKRKRLEEQKRNREKFAQEQNEMLEKARLVMLQQTPFNPIFCSIERLANQMALGFMYSQETKISYEDLVLIYKILVSSKDLLIDTM